VKTIKKWQINLKAEPSLLEKLSVEFCNPELHIFRDTECWFLESTYLDSDESSEIYETGEKLIDFLNQTLWLYAYKSDSIQSNGYYLLNGDEKRICKFLACGGQISAPTLLIVQSNTIPSRNGFDLVVRTEKVRASLALFNNQNIDWFTLFKIYETIRDDDPLLGVTKDCKTLIDEKWSSKQDSKRFRDTAHWHRHSMFRKTSEKPIHPMSLSEAQNFIRRLLISWLEHRSTIQ
jgi:hypothetical protein